MQPPFDSLAKLISFDSLAKFVATLGLATVVVSVWSWKAQSDTLLSSVSAANAAYAELSALSKQSKMHQGIASQLVDRKVELLAQATQLGAAGKVREANQLLDTMPTLSDEIADQLRRGNSFHVRFAEKAIEAERLDALASTQRHAEARYTTLSMLGLAIGIGLLSGGCIAWGRSERRAKLTFPSISSEKK